VRIPPKESHIVRTPRFLPAAAVVLVGLLGAACSSDDDPSVVAGTDTTEEDEAAHNDSDVDFAQGMIPHHEQAVEMASMAATQAESSEVKELAQRIEAAQAPEIEELRSWLEAWGEDEDMGDMDHGSGMMSEDDMGELEAASGAEFDRMFLEMMIQHHEGAIEMAEAEIDDGQFPDAVEMAETIKSTQQDEIDEMEALLDQL
jgi:uncharacterized protein (DUF305 family)